MIIELSELCKVVFIFPTGLIEQQAPTPWKRLRIRVRFRFRRASQYISQSCKEKLAWLVFCFSERLMPHVEAEAGQGIGPWRRLVLEMLPHLRHQRTDANQKGANLGGNEWRLLRLAIYQAGPMKESLALCPNAGFVCIPPSTINNTFDKFNS